MKLRRALALFSISVLVFAGASRIGAAPPPAPSPLAPARIPAAVQTVGILSVTLSPSTITGGSGGTSTGTVTLNGPAPTGGAVVTLTSSNIELAATLPSLTVPQGATSTTFIVATNARYRADSGLGFSATISATHLGSTRSATLNVTAQPRPPDFTSGSQAGSNTQWDGLMCGGIAPIGGQQGILYNCSPATGTGFGTCTFQQECSQDCRRVPPNGGTFNDFCATSGPTVITVSRNYFTGGDHVPATLRTEAPVTIPTTGVPRVINTDGNARSFSPDDVGGIHFPTGVGATSVPFDVATSYVPTIQFVDVGGFWYDDDIPPFLITNGRGGQVWATMLPPNPPPAQPIPTPVQFKIVGLNPVTGGQSSLGQVHTSGIPYGIGPTITFTSSHPGIVPAPAPVTPPASNLFGFDVNIPTEPPASTTDVTVTATDGRYSFSAVLTVLKPPPAPVLSTVSVNPTSVAGGNSATGKVTLSAPQSGATVVALSTPAPSTVAAMPSSVTVPAGATSANFTINTSPVTSQFNMNIFADLAGSPGQQALLLITPGGAPSPTVSALSLNPTSVVGGSPSTGTVTLSAAAPSGGASVALSSSATAAVVDPSVIVAAGATSATFLVDTRSTVTVVTTATISGSFGGTTRSATLTVNPPPPPPPGVVLSSFSVSPASVTGGNPSTGTVRLSAAAPAGGVLVSLGSNLPNSASVPTSVTVAAGATSASFTVTTFDVAATTVQLNALLGDVILFAPITVNSPTSSVLNAVTVNPTSVTGGNSSAGTVTLAAATPELAVVNLSDNSSAVTVPASVTVPVGGTTANFTITTTSVTASTSAIITAVYGPVAQTATVTVNPSGGAPTLSAVSLNPASVVGGNSSTGTVTLSAAAPSGGAVVSLSDNSTAAAPPASVTVLAGATSATFTVTTTTVTASTSATISAVFAGVTRTVNLTVNPATPSAPSLVSPANDATPAQPVTLDWTDVTNAASYEVQVDTSSTIAAPFTANPTVTVSQVTLSGLPAQRLWWRVRARNAAGVFGPFSSTRRFTPQAAPAAASLSALSVSPTSVVGPASATGTATLTSAAPTGGAVVTLSSSNAAATVPASVTVPAGATSATFAVATTAVTASTGVTLTGAYGGATRTTTLTVTPPPPPASLSGVSLNPTSVVGGAASTGTVTLTSAAPTGGAVVSLSSSTTAVASVPVSVTIAAGATSATFTTTTSAVSASTAVTISAVYNGVTRTAALTVNPPSQTATLTVTATGRSGERVTSSPAGINVTVGSTGSASFATGTAITLSVTNGRDAIWSGACSSGGNKTKTCTFTLTGSAAVTANVQ